MAEKKKVRVIFELYRDQYEMLQQVVEQYELPDASKALRCLIDYAALDGDWDEIWRQQRCRRCG